MTGLFSAPSRAGLLSCAALLALSACAAGGDIKPALQPPELSRLNAGATIEEAAHPAGTQTTSPLEWWTIYGDPQLDRLMAIAAEDAPSVTAAMARIRRAEAARRRMSVRRSPAPARRSENITRTITSGARPMPATPATKGNCLPMRGITSTSGANGRTRRLRSNLSGRAADYDVAVSAYRASIATALRQVADGIVTLKSERARKAEANAARDHWRHVVDLQKIRERHGLSDAMDRLASETALLLSERRVAIAQTTLIRALGGAWGPSSPLSTGKYLGRFNDRTRQVTL